MINRNWEIIEINSNREWWNDENWKIQFKFNYRFSLYICFIVEPQFSRNRNKSEGIYEIKATSKFPMNWNDNLNVIGSISLTKKKFDVKFDKFIEDIEIFKKNKNDK
ncbi:hypothetical protein [Tenacibaculum halocynthiae]|uniref:hypothetical protein n=1 Tax=Tenacibaculum halocynthiae TaxID=1254437 RepID=UPI003D64941F